MLRITDTRMKNSRDWIYWLAVYDNGRARSSFEPTSIEDD